MSLVKLDIDKSIPAGFEDSLSEYDELSFDSRSGLPVTWGHRINKHLGDEKFGELYKYGEPEVIDRSSYNCIWGLIKHRLSLSEAVDKYGPITKIFTGPRGGSRHIVFTIPLVDIKPEYKWSTDPIEIHTSNIDIDDEEMFDSAPKEIYR